MSDPAIAGYGHRVLLQADKDTAPAGVWRCLDRSPEPGRWWVQPSDTEARAWLVEHGSGVAAVSGCIAWPSRLMWPPDVAALF